MSTEYSGGIYDTTNGRCSAAAGHAGASYRCDLAMDHNGWAHQSKEGELLWTSEVPPKVTGETSDGHHTFAELYEYRMLYHAHAALGWLDCQYDVVKSWRHADGEECFGGGWFIVTAQLPTGQVSNHYEAKYWDLFKVPEAETAPEWDGHTPAQAAERLRAYLEAEA